MSTDSRNNVLNLPRKDPSKEEIKTALQGSRRTKEQHQEEVRKYCEEYLSRGWHPLKLEDGTKKIETKGWNTGSITFSPSDFTGFNNIGVLLGDFSGILDVDIDDLELIEAAPLFLPETGARFGRYYGLEQQQLAHYLYRCSGAKSFKLKRPNGSGDKATAIEVRGLDENGPTGKQTVFPPSYILDKERRLDLVCWEGGSSARVPEIEKVKEASFDELCSAARLLAATVYSVPLFKSGSFHDDMMGWAGLLAKAGYSREDARKSVAYIVEHSGQLNLKDRLNAIESTYDKYDAGLDVIGITQLKTANCDNKFLSWLKGVLPQKTGLEDDQRPKVRIINSKEAKWYDLTLKAMVETEKFYQVSGQTCVVVKRYGKVERLILDNLIGAEDWLSREILFTKAIVDKESGITTEQEIVCPKSIASRVANATSSKGALSELIGISCTPIITKSGRIIDDAWAYDEELKTFFACEFPVQTMYKEEALPVILDVMQDFPFSSDRYKVAALSAILTAVIRPVLDICPMYVVTSSQPADGKSVLSGLIAASAGVEASLGQLTRSGSDEEQAKQLSAILIKGSRVVTLDNHDREFSCPALAETLTSENPSFRVLGKNESRSVPNKTMFLLNGLNTVPAQDLQTRSVFVRLSQKSVNPERKFKYYDVQGYTYNNRAKIVSAAIALIKWGIEQGDGEWRPTHRFKTWDYLVRRTVLLLTGEDVAPPLHKDSDRSVSAEEEAKHQMRPWIIDLWDSGSLTYDGKKDYFLSRNIAEYVVEGSDQEGWIDVLSRRPRESMVQKVGKALNAVSGDPFEKDGFTCSLVVKQADGMNRFRITKVKKT